MERPGVGVGVIIERAGKVFLQKRRGAHGEGTWSLPGGKLDFGESPEECAIREVKEECGMVIQNPKFVTITNDLFRERNIHYITLFLRAESSEGEPKITEPEKTTEQGWFSWDKLPQPLFLPLKNFLKNGFPKA